jgi:DNA-binding CsgD family transcriptional regulator
VAAPVKHQMSLQEIAEETGMSVAAVNVCLGRALKKLRNRGLLVTTARALAIELERHRATSHSLSRPRSARKGGAQ